MDFKGSNDHYVDTNIIFIQENSEENKLVLKQIKKHVSDLMVIIKRAANYLKPIRPSGTRSDATTGSSSAMMLLATILINYLYSF